MIYNISWQGYWTALAVIVAIYYGLIILWFNKPIVVSWFFSQARLIRKRLQFNKNYERQPTASTISGSSPALRSDQPESIPGMTSLVDEIQVYFESVPTAYVSKVTLLLDIHNLVQKYPQVPGTAFQSSVENLIMFLAKQNLSVYLSADDVSAVWIR